MRRSSSPPVRLMSLQVDSGTLCQPEARLTQFKGMTNVRNNGARNLWWPAIFSMVIALQCANADVVTEWNVTAIDASAQTNALVQSRALAITHAAVFDAVNAIAGKYKAYLAEVKAPAGASQEAAATASAHAVLSWLLLAQKGMPDAALTSSLANGWRCKGRRCCSR